jgi:hypothetical protein
MPLVVKVAVGLNRDAVNPDAESLSLAIRVIQHAQSH